jgi:CheY-like chemotaxis protein
LGDSAKSMSGDVSRRAPAPNRRILVVDDNKSIHLDFRKVLCPAVKGAGLNELATSLFGAPEQRAPGRIEFEIDSAYQGKQALDMVLERRSRGQHYAMAFVDMRMPPRWDGLQTVEHLWTAQKNLRIVFCSAYSDYSWKDVVGRLGTEDVRWLRKPFATRDVMALALEFTTG